MEIRYSRKFLRMYKKLSLDIKKNAEKRIEIFRENVFDSRLETHKLSGDFDDCWAFSIDYKNRIIFSFYNKNIILLIAVGDHSVYK